jgi:hypothetical protein
VRRPAKPRTEAAIQQVKTALAAVDEASLWPTDEVTRKQLALAQAALTTMVDSLATVIPAAKDTSWLGQMVADQWDPKSSLTELVLRAAQAFAKAVSDSH